MVTVLFQTLLRRSLGVSSVQIPLQEDVCTLDALITACEAELGVAIRPLLVTDDEELMRGVMILLNGRNVLLLQGLQTAVRSGDTIHIFPPAGGG